MDYIYLLYVVSKLNVKMLTLTEVKKNLDAVIMYVLLLCTFYIFPQV